jgi:hypothetical protein
MAAFEEPGFNSHNKTTYTETEIGKKPIYHKKSWW